MKTNDIEDVVVFNSEYPVETMFYSNCTAYSAIPDSLTLSFLADKGYTIFIRQNMEGKPEFNYNQEFDIVLSGHNIRYCKWKKDF